MNTSVVALKMNLVHDGFFFLKTYHRTAVRINAAGKHVSEDCRLFEVYAHAPVLYTIRVCYVFNNNPLPQHSFHIVVFFFFHYYWNRFYIPIFISLYLKFYFGAFIILCIFMFVRNFLFCFVFKSHFFQPNNAIPLSQISVMVQWCTVLGKLEDSELFLLQNP